MELNTQPIEKQVDRLKIEVHSVFDTIQGEGPFAGTPATFIRLSGCNLNCQWCDTDYTSMRVYYTVPDLIVHLQSQFPVRSLVVITGGEPFRQNIVPLVRKLLHLGRDVQIETNGTLINPDMVYLKGNKGFSVVCSPKTREIKSDMWDWITALKYVVEAGKIDPEDGLPLSSVGPQYGRPARPPIGWQGPIYIQPLDSQDPEKNSANIKAAVDSCLKFGYRLCVQIQKICDLP